MLLPATLSTRAATRAGLALLSLLPLACRPSDNTRPLVGLITKTETNPFFVTMRHGADSAARHAGVRLVSGAGRSDGDNAGQVTAIENQVTAGARVIMISPSDAKAIVPAIRKAREAGVLVIAVDSPTDPMDASDAFFGTDNYRAGELIGQYARARLGETPAKIITIDLIPGHPTGAQRHNGFLKGFGLPSNDRASNELAKPGEVVCMGDGIGDQSKAQTVMENCLQQHPEVNVVYTINEPSGAGAFVALRQAKREKDVILVTVDGGCRGVEDVASGRFAATAQQYPIRMATLGIDAAMAFLKDDARPTGYTDTGVALVAGTPAPGITSLTPAEGAAKCWGTK